MLQESGMIDVLDIPRWRYEELVGKEECLRMLTDAIRRQSEYDTLRDIKRVFDLYGKEEV